MKMYVQSVVIVLLLIMTEMLVAGEADYRIAGIIANGSADWQAIIERPDGEQMLVKKGDLIGRIEVVDISKDGVTLQFPNGIKQMQLSEGGYFSPPVDVVSRPQNAEVVFVEGVSVGDYTRLLKQRLTPDMLARVRGLETLDRLSASARIVSYSYLGELDDTQTPIESIESGVHLLQQAIIEGKELRIKVENGDLTYIYVMPNPQQ